MKNILGLLVIISLLISRPCFGQENMVTIGTKWEGLKTHFISRSNIILELTNRLAKSKGTNQSQIKELKKSSAEFINCIGNIQQLDSISIAKANHKNISLEEILSKAITGLENDHFEISGEILDIIMRLEGVENRINIARIAYNAACDYYKRGSLKFGSDEIEEAVEVKF